MLAKPRCQIYNLTIVILISGEWRNEYICLLNATFNIPIVIALL